MGLIFLMNLLIHFTKRSERFIHKSAVLICLSDLQYSLGIITTSDFHYTVVVDLQYIMISIEILKNKINKINISCYQSNVSNNL